MNLSDDHLRMLSAVFAFGALLGMIHFGGLLATVFRVAEFRRPYLMLTVSFIVRMAVVIAGFYWVSAHQWDRLVAALLGFMMARLIWQRIVIRPGNQSP